MAADRGPYIDQSQSLNIHMAEPNYAKITSMHFHAWKLVGSSLLTPTNYWHVLQLFDSYNFHELDFWIWTSYDLSLNHTSRVVIAQIFIIEIKIFSNIDKIKLCITPDRDSYLLSQALRFKIVCCCNIQLYYSARYISIYNLGQNWTLPLNLQHWG